MITRFRVQNYKALRDVTVELTPMHVLIGPNDTGKTSILEAIGALCRSVDRPLAEAFAGSWEGQALVWRGDTKRTVLLHANLESPRGSFEYELDCRFLRTGRKAQVWREVVTRVPGGEPTDLGYKDHLYSGVFAGFQGKGMPEEHRDRALLVHDALRGVHFYRWVPRLLSLPVAADSKCRFRMETSGFGLARCLDDIAGYDEDLSIKLKKRFTGIFKEISKVRLMPEPAWRAPTDAPEQIDLLTRADGKGIYFKLANGGTEIPASQMSDGVLLVLAYLAILYLPEPPRVLLVEEPENGIHPKRLKDVLTILRDLVKEQSHTQVILTTHSPYVVDLFEPKEVTLCRKEQDGSISVTRLSESKTVREQLDVFTLGEIWTGEGDDALAEPAAPQDDSAK